MRFIQTVRDGYISVNSIREIKANGKGQDRKYVVFTKDAGPLEIYHTDYEALTEVVGRHLGCVPAQTGWYVVHIGREADGAVWIAKEPITAWRVDVDGQSHPVTCDEAGYHAILAPDGSVREPGSTYHESMDAFRTYWERGHPAKSEAKPTLSEA